MFSLPSLTLPLWLLLIPFGIFILFFILYAFFNIYHLLRFATYTFGSYLLTTIFIGGAVIISAVSYLYLSSYDWTITWTFTDLLSTPSL